jgi:3-mercaptopyruvate sulfurtransferase SseA
VAFKLRQLGFTRIRPLLGGLDAWIDAGMPVDGDEPSGNGGGAPWTGTPPPAGDGAVS